MSSKALACVMGGMDLVRPLGLAGIRCAMVARRGDPVRFSRFTQAVLDWDDRWDRSEELAQMLLGFAAGQAQAPVLFYEDDQQLLFVSRFRETLKQAFRFVIAESTLVEELVNKARFQALAQRLALPVPRSRVLNAAEGAAYPPELDLRFPVVLKPVMCRGKYWTRVAGLAKALGVATPSALRELWPRLVAASSQILVQESIPGSETCIESYHVYVDERGETVGEFTGKKIRTYPVEYGSSTAVAITDNAEVRALGRDLVRRLNLRGVAKFDFKRGPDGKLWLLEVNPRFNLWHHPGAVAGVNLPALVYADLMGLPRPAVSGLPGQVRWCAPLQDAVAARTWGVPAVQWLPWLLGCETISEGAWDDPLPFLRGAFRRLCRYAVPFLRGLPSAALVAARLRRPQETPGTAHLSLVR